MRRLTILLAAVGALLLVPAAQAFANDTVTVNIEGTGKGKVTNVGGVGEFGGPFEEYGSYYEGPEALECSGPPTSGTCEVELANEGEEIEGIALHAAPSPGSKVAEFLVSSPGQPLLGCESKGVGCEEAECPIAAEYCLPFELEGQGGFEVTIVFAKEPSKGPTNKRTLSLSKSGTGAGSVASKPKGIKCGFTCATADASLYKEQTVVLTAKAAATAGSTFTGWEGCEAETVAALEGTCTVKMTEAKSVVAEFGGTKKAILNPQVLTLTKGGNGHGTVKATGLACEPDCIQTKVEYTGGDGGKKLPAVVTLSQTPAADSTFTGWEGCESEVEGKCVVTMSAAKSVTASYALRPVETLTVSKAGTGAGSVASKPKGVKCGFTCTEAQMAAPQETTVVLTAKAAATAGSTFTGWEGCEAETVAALEGTCTVKLSEAKSVVAEFGGTKKAILNPKALTLTKTGSAYGTVKATGLACEPACTSTSVEYTGGDGGKKLPATVVLKAVSAPGAKAVEWAGCDSIDGEGNCVVTMSSAKSVTATFDELE